MFTAVNIIFMSTVLDEWQHGKFIYIFKLMSVELKPDSGP